MTKYAQQAAYFNGHVIGYDGRDYYFVDDRNWCVDNSDIYWVDSLQRVTVKNGLKKNQWVECDHRGIPRGGNVPMILGRKINQESGWMPDSWLIK
jgi:hypothetical protein